MAKSLQRKKPGYTKGGVAKIISMNTKQLVNELEKTQKAKIKAKITRRLDHFGYVASVVVEEISE
jgi:hypothetical protein